MNKKTLLGIIPIVVFAALQTAISELRMDLSIKEVVKEEIANQGLHLLGVVPQDETVYEYDCDGKPTASLPEDNPVKKALREIAGKLSL